MDRVVPYLHLALERTTKPILRLTSVGAGSAVETVLSP